MGACVGAPAFTRTNRKRQLQAPAHYRSLRASGPHLSHLIPTAGVIKQPSNPHPLWFCFYIHNPHNAAHSTSITGNNGQQEPQASSCVQPRRDRAVCLPTVGAILHQLTWCRLRHIPLPPKLKCNMCLRNYNQANFSEKQKTDVRWQISRAGKITTLPKCFKCTGGQLVEIECVMCHKTKGLEDYAKTQRRKPDDAVRILDLYVERVLR